MRGSKRWGVAATVLLAAAAVAVGRPGDGIRVGNLALSPFVDVAVTYDSNVFLQGDDQEDDYFLDLVPGVAFINRTDRLILKGRGWGQIRRYLDYDKELDHESYGGKLGGVLGGVDNPGLIFNAKYIHLDDYEISPRSVDTLNIEAQDLMLTEDRTERTERDIFDVGGVIGRDLTDKLRADLGYSYSTVDYDTDLLFDWDESRLQLELSHDLTDKTAALLTGQYSWQDSDGFEDESIYYLGRAGIEYRATGKTTFKGGVGFESYEAGGLSPEGESLDDDLVSYDVAAIWEATRKLTLQLSGRNGIQPATQYQSNTKEINLVSLGASYRFTEEFRLSLAGSFRQDDYIARIPFEDELREKQREHYGVRVRMDYWPRAKFYDLYVEASYEDVTDNLEDDYENYDQLRVSAGLSLRY